MNTLKYLGSISIIAAIFVGCNLGQKKQVQEEQQKAEPIPDVTVSTNATIETHLETYVNSVYRYHIKYPDQLLIPQGESDSGDGQIFVSKDSLCELRVYRDTRDILYEGAILKKSYREDMNSFQNDSILNSELTENYYLIEGKSKSEYFHQKTILRKDNLLVTAIYSYKPEAKETYSPTVDPTLNSMR